MANVPSPKPKQDPNHDIVEYVVTAAAITYRTAKDDVRTFTRGQRLRLHSEEQRVKELVHSKSIGLRGADSVNAQTVLKAFGSPEDPALAPRPEHLPLPATPDQVAETI